MKRIDLCGAWILTDQNGRQYPAHVPGCVHTDVIKEDMFWRDNAKNCQWIENQDWRYTRLFEVEKIEEEMFLLFEGLDVYCDIFLNGKKVGSAENMFIPHKFCVDGIVQQGKNEISVQFYSPVERVRDKPERNAVFSRGRLNTRRMQCTYGWDWVDRFVTCGIFRPVALIYDHAFAIDNLYVYTAALDEYGAVIKVSGETRNFCGGAGCSIQILDPDGVCVYEKEEFINTQFFDEDICIENPRLWYPAGYGEQPIYTLLITWANESLSQKFGIRTVRILEKKDSLDSAEYTKCQEMKQYAGTQKYDQNEEGTSFILIVNGIRIYCRGYDYVPCEPFPSEETPAKITALLELAAEGGANMLRIWGGGIYETAHFYDECDRLGIMITHDFFMACGEYPEDEEWFISELQKEARFAALHLRNHPCLMWWHGDNENAFYGRYDLACYTGKRAAYQGVLPVLRTLDYTHRFLISSPYGGKTFISKLVGTTHNTGYLDLIFGYILNEDMSDYKEFFQNYTARFISEDLAVGAVGKNTLLRMMTEEDINSEDLSMWRYHIKSSGAPGYDVVDNMFSFAKKVFGDFQNPDDRLFKLQYAKYEWIRVTMENHRRNQWFNAGVLYWMLNDCWRAAGGWAAIDYDCIPTSGFYSFKRCAKQLVSSVWKGHNGLQFAVSNNSPAEHTLTVYGWVLENGEEKKVLEQTLIAPENQVTGMTLPFDVSSKQALICEIWEDGKMLDRSFYQNGRLEIVPCAGVTTAKLSEHQLKLKADRYVHAVGLSGDFVFEDNFFSMRKGEERVLSYRMQIPSEMEIVCYTLK